MQVKQRCGEQGEREKARRVRQAQRLATKPPRASRSLRRFIAERQRQWAGYNLPSSVRREIAEEAAQDAFDVKVDGYCSDLAAFMKSEEW